MTTGKLNNGLPQVPPRRGQPTVQVSRLPIEDMRGEIAHAIISNQVVLISGETGCGKTTQVCIVNICSRTICVVVIKRRVGNRIIYTKLTTAPSFDDILL